MLLLFRNRWSNLNTLYIYWLFDTFNFKINRKCKHYMILYGHFKRVAKNRPLVLACLYTSNVYFKKSQHGTLLEYPIFWNIPPTPTCQNCHSLCTVIILNIINPLLTINLQMIVNNSWNLFKNSWLSIHSIIMCTL